MKQTPSFTFKLSPTDALNLDQSEIPLLGEETLKDSKSFYCFVRFSYLFCRFMIEDLMNARAIILSLHMAICIESSCEIDHTIYDHVLIEKPLCSLKQGFVWTGKLFASNLISKILPQYDDRLIFLTIS